MSAKKSNKFIHFIMMVMVLLLGTSSLLVSDLPTDSYIVQGDNLATVIELVESQGGLITSELEIIDGVAAYLHPYDIAVLQAHPSITYITPNAVVEASALPEMDLAATMQAKDTPSADAPEAIGADYVWEQGIMGEGVTIAIVDSGMTKFNPLISNTDKQNRLLAWKDFVNTKRNSPTDPNGHGTHLISIIANSVKGADGSYNGIAPNVNLVVVRVLDQEGHSDYETVIKGIDWVVKHRDEYNIKVLNLSLTGTVAAPYWADPLNRAVMQAWSKGITVVTCAGNVGPDPMSVSVPGNNPYIITVGAFTDAYTPKDWTDDYLAEFSSAGPTQDAFIKPDLVAPGAHMMGLMGKNSYISQNHEANQVGDTKYFEMAGTSQAAAVVTGVVALMYQQNPDLTPDEVKYRLMITAMPMIESGVDPELAKANYSVFQQGAGRLNAPDAVFATEGVDGLANVGMNINKDLKDKEHYQGFVYYDEATSTYGVTGVENTNDGYSVWDGGYGIWSGGFGIWSGGFGIWSGGFGIWSGGFGIWSGNFGLWDEPILMAQPTTMSMMQTNENTLSDTKSFAATSFDYKTMKMPDFAQMRIGTDRWVDD